MLGLLSIPQLCWEPRPGVQPLQVLDDDGIWVSIPLPQTKSTSAGPVQRKGLSGP